MKENRKKYLIASRIKLIVVTVICIAILYTLNIWPGKGQTAFVSKWSQRLQHIDSPSKIPENYKNDLYALNFSNGEWIITAMDHSCCSGSGFDATVIRDSRGKVAYDVSHTFCGFEGMSSELGHLKATSLDEFYSKATFLKLKENKTEQKH